MVEGGRQYGTYWIMAYYFETAQARAEDRDDTDTAPQNPLGGWDFDVISYDNWENRV